MVFKVNRRQGRARVLATIKRVDRVLNALGVKTPKVPIIKGVKRANRSV